MKLVKRKNKIFIFLSVIFVCGIYSLPSFAQGICPITTIKLGRIKGKVVSQGKNEVPISATKVELFNLNENKVLIDSVMTDEKGFFKFDNINKGIYGLTVWFTIKGQTYLKYDVILKVTKNQKEKENNKMVYVRLGMDCFNSDAKLIDEKPVLTLSSLTSGDNLKKCQFPHAFCFC